MAVALVRDHTGMSIKTAGATNAYVNISTATTQGNTLVARILFDNSASGLPTITTIAKPANETASWVFLGAARSPGTTPGAAASGEMWAIRTTVPWPVAQYTVTLSASVTQKATDCREFSGVLAVMRSTVGSNYNGTTTPAIALTSGTAPVVGDLAVGFIFGSNVAAAQAGSNNTTGGSWSAASGLGSTGGSAATNNFGVSQYKIVTSTAHQNYTNSATMTAGNGAICAILQQADTPSITQAAYRIYADGTESGSTAAAAQDTAYTASIAAGDVNLQVRTRLQSTSAVAVDPWDGFQLQWEKNASGSWTDVTPGPGVVDRYDDSNMTSLYSHTTSTWVMGQSFMGNGTNLSQAKFYFMSTGTPTGQLTAYLYAHTGVFGTSSNYTGTALATSTPVSESVIGEGPVWVAFDFNGSYQLVRGTPYVIAYKRSVTDSVNYVNPGFDNSSPTAAGNLTSINVPYAGEDFIFEVSGIGGASGVAGYNPVSLTEGAATTNRLTGGTGTFVAGKVSEDGLVDGLGWSGNNYTELLYSITLKAADLADGDTLRFRVLRNGETTGLTYTQTPTIPVTLALGPSFSGSDRIGTTDSMVLAISDNNTDALALTDPRSIAADVAEADSLGISDTATFDKSSTVAASDPVAVTDDGTFEKSTFVAIDQSDLASIADSRAAAADVARTDSLGTTDSRTADSAPARADSLGISDTATFDKSSTADAQDSVGLIDTTSLNIGNSLLDPLALMDSSTKDQAASRSDTLAPSDSRTIAVGSEGSDLTGLTDSAGTASALAQNRTKTMFLTDSVLIQLSTDVALSDQSALSDSWAESLAADRTDTEPLTDTIAKSLATNRSDAEALTDTVLVERSLAGTWSDSIALADTIAESLASNRSDDAGLVDQASIQAAGAGTYSTVEPLGLTDSWSVVLAGSRSDNAGPTDLVSVQVVKSVAYAETLPLADSRVLALVGSRSDTAPLTDSRSLLLGRPFFDASGMVDSVSFVLAASSGRPQVWTGAVHEKKPGKVWTGSGWVEKPWKSWDGSVWDPA